VLSFVLLALRFFPAPTERVTTTRRLPFDIPIRMAVATLFVLVITGLASVLGPNWSGILTPFPIMTSVLAIFSHTLQGSNAAITTLRGLVIGLLGFTTFLFLQAFLLPSFSVASSFAMAFGVNAAINLIASRIW
jgi:polyferredoxin